MAEVKSCLSFELNAEQQVLLRNVLMSGNYRTRNVPYTIIAVDGNGFNCALYQKERHGVRKVCVQGTKAQEFVEFVLQPHGIVPVTMGGDDFATQVEESAKAPLPHAGSDESGKGDYYGPLVVACCYVDEDLNEKLRKLKVEWYDSCNVKHVDEGGVRDCKVIANNGVLLRMGHLIREMLGSDRYNIVKIGPAAYNRLYAKIRNVNRLLAWAHGTCIEGLLQKQPACKRVVVDQFAPTEAIIKRSMKELGKQVVLEQRHKAESYSMAVAAASVLARETFLRSLCDMAVDIHPDNDRVLGIVPLGASDPKVRTVAENMVRRDGPVWLMNHCKVHFQTTDKILIACGRSRKDLPPEGQITSAVKSGEYKHV